MTGCTAYSPWKMIDGSIPGNKNDLLSGAGENQLTFFNEQKCNAFNGIDGNGVYADARCCEYTNNDYRLECGYIVGKKSGTSDDDLSIISCPNGYFMAGCSGYSPWKSAEAWYIDDNDRCITRNMINGQGVYSIGTCCKELKKI